MTNGYWEGQVAVPTSIDFLCFPTLQLQPTGSGGSNNPSWTANFIQSPRQLFNSDRWSCFSFSFRFCWFLWQVIQAINWFKLPRPFVPRDKRAYWLHACGSSRGEGLSYGSLASHVCWSARDKVGTDSPICITGAAYHTTGECGKCNFAHCRLWTLTVWLFHGCASNLINFIRP